MRIITERKLRDFWQAAKGNERGAREKVMREWIKTVKSADWQTFADIRKTFNHADILCTCTIFDVGGNKYRIIGKMAYRKHAIYIRFVLTHKEYDENTWQADCC
jgi:mRNA interferase HigB